MALERWPREGEPRIPPPGSLRRPATGQSTGSAATRRWPGRPSCSSASPNCLRRRTSERESQTSGSRSSSRVVTRRSPRTPRWRSLSAKCAGLTTTEIARAFLTAEPTMAQRVVRAKRDHARPESRSASRSTKSSRTACMPCWPSSTSSSTRATAQPPTTTSFAAELSDEAIRLGKLLAVLMPDEADVLALLALMLFQDSRREARTGPSGELVLLEDQDRSLWNRDRIDEGARVLEHAHRLDRPVPMGCRRRSPRCTRRPSGRRRPTGRADRCSLRGARAPGTLTDRRAEPRGRGGDGGWDRAGPRSDRADRGDRRLPPPARRAGWAPPPPTRAAGRGGELLQQGVGARSESGRARLPRAAASGSGLTRPYARRVTHGSRSMTAALRRVLVRPPGTDFPRGGSTGGSQAAAEARSRRSTRGCAMALAEAGAEVVVALVDADRNPDATHVFDPASSPTRRRSFFDRERSPAGRGRYDPSGFEAAAFRSPPS